MTLDYANKETDKVIEDIEKRLKKEYAKASKEMEKKAKAYFQRFEEEDKQKIKQLNANEITEKDYLEWRRNRMLTGQDYANLRDTLAKDCTNANQIAAKIVNNKMSDVYASNFNYGTYELENQTQIDTSFSLYNHDTVEELIKNNEIHLPKPSVDIPKDLQWNASKVNSALLQSVLQGMTFPEIVKGLQKVTNMNLGAATRNARTMMTSAESAGRLDALKRGAEMGIPSKKEWRAVLDGRTRHSHVMLDGERVPLDEAFSNGLMYPGDPSGAAEEIYNCRCRIRRQRERFESDASDLSLRQTSKLGNMTYQEWKDNKKPKEFRWNKQYKGVYGRDYGKADTSDALREIQVGEKLWNNKTNSLEDYLDKDGNLTPEREMLHKKIIDKYLSGKKPESGTATMVMMGGGPASGKSSVTKSGLYKLPDKTHTVTIDPDEIKQYLPGYLKMSKTNDKAASFYHEESSMIAKQLASTCFSENYNVVYDGTGDGSVKSVMKKINGAKEKGYKVNGMYVTIDTEEALIRNKKRYDNLIAKGEAPRLVPDDYVIDCHKKVTQISMETSDQFDSISLYDNNGAQGEIKLIATGGNGKKLAAIPGQENAFEKFLDKGK